MLFDQLQQFAFAHDGVVEVEARKLDLARPVGVVEGLQQPVVEGPVDLELQRAERVGHALEGVFEGMGEVVHGVDAPLVPVAEVVRPADAVQHRIPQIDVGVVHVDLGPQDHGLVFELARAHPAEEVEILLHAAAAVGGLLSRSPGVALVLLPLLLRDVADVGFAPFYQFFGALVHAFEVVAGEIDALFGIETQPLHVFDDGVDVFVGLLGGIRVVHAQIADAAELSGDAEVQADGLGVTDVQIAVGFRREPRHHPAAVLAGLDLFRHDRPDEIQRRLRRSVFRIRHDILFPVDFQCSAV